MSDILRQYEASAQGFRDFAIALPAFSEIPAEVIQSNVSAANDVASSLDSAIACFENVSVFAANPCSSEGNVLQSKASAAGVTCAN